jgi:DNA-directed RNA polymerase subunit beta
MPQTVKYGRRERLSFARISEVMELPDLIEIQKKSYEEFLQKDVPPEEREDKGLQAVFKEIFPIYDLTETSYLDFVSYSIGKPKYDVTECQERGMTYAAPLKIRVRLVVREKDKETGEKQIVDIRESDVYMGELPLMTERGTFVINGAERVVVSQLHRSPGVTFNEELHSSGRKLFSAKITPYRGAWLEFEYDAQGQIHVRLDRRKRMLATVILRALGWESDEEILSLFADSEELEIKPWKDEIVEVEREDFDSLLGRIAAEDVQDPETDDLILTRGERIGGIEIQRLKTSSLEKVRALDESFPSHLIGKVVAKPIVNEETGEVIADVNDEITYEILKECWEQGINKVAVLKEEDAVRIESLRTTLKRDDISSQEEALVEIFRKLQPSDPPTIESAKLRFERLYFDSARYDLSQVGRYKINKKLGLDIPSEVRVLTKEDILETLRYLIKVENGEGEIDDIDHLGNRRVRAVGELLQNQVRVGLTRLARSIRDRMAIVDMSEAHPHDLVNHKPLSGAIKDFFGSSQLSQFMQQTNPLDELTHKRRLSALGPGGLHRDRATFEVRDVHHTHYGRVCPIETPEGPSVGLIVSLSTYARINDYGFLETPYRKVKNGYVTDEIEYLTADEEDQYVIAQANAETDEDGRLMGDRIVTRYKGDFPEKPVEEVDYIDVSPKQVVSVSASLIPFLEHDDANRALMGSNMQRQAVPLLIPQAPLVGTGMEHKAAVDSGAVVTARRAGVVESVSSDEIIIRADEALDLEDEDKISQIGEYSFTEMGYDVYKLLKFKRTNGGTCINQRPVVKVGEHVEAGQVIADGSSSDQGELALGANVLVAFMPWEGYNFEDAVVISERLVQEDVFTSIHLEEFEIEARDTKLGREEITRDIPNVSEEALRNLDEDGIIRVGSYVKPGDILVGKVTPKGETDLGPEEKLLRAIFGEKASDVRDASLYAKPGVEGVVVDVKVFSRKEREKDKLTRLREEAHIKEAEKECEAKINLINQRKEQEIRRLLLGQMLAIDLEKDGEIIAQRGDIITEEMLDSGLPLDEFIIASAEVTRQIGRIKRLAQGRVEAALAEKREKIEKIKGGDELKPGVIKLVKVYIATKRKISVGDKVAGRHGNKGVIAKILPQEDMPYLEDGTPVDIILNPLGVPSRMNIGQILETHLGWAAKALGLYIASPVFDGATEGDIKELLKKADLPVSGKTKLYDGRTGEPFEQEITVGWAYIMKLHHLVDDKIHARSIGPYSLVTQQPLGGKAQQGGQRLGEMEVWALEAYGAAYSLQEMLTVKSDDVVGRSGIYEAMVKGENAPEPGIPESFNVLVKELQSLALSVQLERETPQEEEEEELQEDIFTSLEEES